MLTTILDLIFPLRCAKCGNLVTGNAGLCPACWQAIPFISKPMCYVCGLPFAFEIEEGALCGPCLKDLPVFTSARSVFAYTPDSRDLILRFKHLDALHTTPLFAEWMTRLYDNKTAICVPVPLHWTRLFKRTYNQAALLAQRLAHLKGWDYSPTILRRVKRTPSQGYMKRAARIQNVSKAFQVLHPDEIASQCVILIDDVMTTGATLNACAKVLLNAGATEVHALTLGRVLLPERL